MKLMRKIFTALLFLGIFFLPSAHAGWKRNHLIYSFEQSEKTNTKRYTPPQWRTTRSHYLYRFSSQFKRSDYLQWRTMEPRGSSSEETGSPISKDFCNYSHSIMGEYLPSEEVKNRCCVCLDGWKCQYSSIASSTKQHLCDADWKPPNTTRN